MYKDIVKIYIDCFDCNMIKPDWSQTIYNLSAGIGTLLLGVGALKFLSVYVSSIKKNILRSEMRNKYPANKHKKYFELITSTRQPGWVYLLDKQTKEVRHIASMLTLERLGYSRDWAKKVPDKIFDKYILGKEIWTDGEKYS